MKVPVIIIHHFVLPPLKVIKLREPQSFSLHNQIFRALKLEDNINFINFDFENELSY